MIATSGAYLWKLRSLSSASATKISPAPWWALLPGVSRSPPMAYDGSRPSAPRLTASMLVVVVLPCVPATAMARRPPISAASASERCTTGMPRSRAAASSGLSSRMALETTMELAPSGTCSAAWPTCTAAPSSRSASTVSDSFESLPETLAPRTARIFARPDMPAPPIPMKCGACRSWAASFKAGSP